MNRGFDPLQSSPSLPALPQDALQPWERASSDLLPTTFLSGSESFLEDSAALQQGSALQLASSASGLPVWAMYRLTLAGEAPGSVSVDVNLPPALIGTTNEYWLGLSDYAKGSWDWYGPLRDNHVVVSLGSSGSDYLSELGNLFVVLAACQSATCSVVGVGVEAHDPGDSIAPAAPAGLSAEGCRAGIELAWEAAAAEDLAGYRVYYNSQAFSGPEATGLRRLPVLLDYPRCIISTDELDLPATSAFFRVAAVDHSGNESPLSPQASAAALSGEAAELALNLSIPSGFQGQPATLTALGADTYSFDADGDGQFEVSQDETGQLALDTSEGGLLRVKVRATAPGDPTARALRGASLLLGQNQPPTAGASANRLSGTIPLRVTFTGTAEDAEDALQQLSFAWDFDGDGIYEPDTGTLNPPQYTYNDAGLYTVRFRVEDSGGATDVAEVEINAINNYPPVAVLAADPEIGDAPLLVTFDASGSTDEDGYVADYQWDWNDDGLYDEDTDTDSIVQHEFPEPGQYRVRLRIYDNKDAMDTTTIDIGVRGWGKISVVEEAWDGTFARLIEMDEAPAIAYLSQEFLPPFGSDERYKFVRCSTAPGLLKDDWSTPVDIGKGNENGIGFALINGNPAISSYDNDSVRFTRSATPGGTEADWGDGLSLPGGDLDPLLCQLLQVEGTPAVFGNIDAVGSRKILYWHSSSPDGSELDDWTETAEIQADVRNEYGFSVAMVAGQPALAYRDYVTRDLCYIRSTTADGNDDEDWTDIVVVEGGELETGDYPSLAVINGKPAIAYVHSDNDVLMYAHSSTATGADEADWSLVTVDAADEQRRFISLAQIGGAPAIAFFEDSTDELRYAESSTATGAQTEDWSLIVVDSEGFSGSYCSLAEIADGPGIAYHQINTQDLRYAARF